MNTIMLLSFALYFCILTFIGILSYFKTKNSDDFMLGGRSVNYFVTAIATQASDMSSFIFLGLPAAVYAHGFLEIWTAIGLVFFMFLNWQFIAPKLRRETEQYQSLTLSSYFHARYNDSTGMLRMVSALVTIIFFTFYIASGLVGLGRLFEAAFGIGYHAGTLIGLLTVIVYTLIGGFLAVAWSNLFQGLFLLVMIVMVPAAAYYALPGWHTIVQSAQAHNIPLQLIPSATTLLYSISLIMGWGLGYFGQPHILVNFMGIDDPNKIKYAKYVGITWQIIVLTASIAIGIIGIGYFAPQYTLVSGESVFIIMAKELFNPLIAGFALCGIFAATLSTMDTHILISGSVLAEDIYGKIKGKSASSQHLLLVSRIGATIISLCALGIAFNNSNSVYDLVNYAWAGLGSSFGPLVIASLYATSVTTYGALSGIIVGSTVAALWPYVNCTILPLVPGFTLSLLSIYVVSLVTKKE
jgi:sodium/proline symporter